MLSTCNVIVQGPALIASNFPEPTNLKQLFGEKDHFAFGILTAFY